MHQPLGSFGYGESAVAASAVAIVGMSCRFAGVRSLDEYWALLREGREAIETFSQEQLIAAGVSPSLLRQPNYVARGAPISDMECFDAALFGLSQRDAAIMDPQHRHFLECTWEALENAGYTPQGFAEENGGVIGVFAGSGHNAYMPYNLLTNPKLVRDVGMFLLRHTSNDKDFLTTRVSYLLDLKGPSINVQTACSTSLVALHMAAQSLLAGECDMALAGGASIELPHRQGYMFEEGEILSPDGHCRPFDAASKGTVFGSGVAVLALRRLEDAIAAGDHIHAVMRGSAINNDGSGKVGYLAPSVDGQARVIAEALAVAEVDPEEIDYVEAHGTGTPIGDPIEVAALTQVFRQSDAAVGRCALGSVKANIGHTDTAAGAAGVIKVALAMQNGEIPPVPHFTSANPDCALDASPFRVPASCVLWPRRDHSPRRAGVSSLGVGGTNAHVIMEEAPLREAGSASRRHQLLLTSGQTAEAARANLAALGAHLAAHPDTCLADAAFTLETGRRHLSVRRFAVAGDAGEAAHALEAAAADMATRPPCVPGRPVAFLFCGGGAQHIDMACGLYETEAVFRTEVDRGLELATRIGLPDLRRWIFPMEADRKCAAEQLERPSNALPALFIIQTALARLWMSLGIQPTVMIGHSCGEYAAAHISGVVDLETGLRIVHTRGRLFETTGNGAMLSVPLSEAEVAAILPPGLSIATINAPRLCVVSGDAEAIAIFHDELAAREIEASAIPITVAAHSPMLDPILPEFRAALRTMELHAPTIPFASNLTGDWVRAEEATDPEYWVRHLREPVRFTDGLHRLLDDPTRVLLEVGPGRSMASLARQHPARAATQPVISSMRHQDQQIADDACWMQALGELWASGVEVDWKAWWGTERRLRIPLPTYRFDRQRHWIEPGAALSPIGAGHTRDARLDIGDWGNEPVWTRCEFPTAELLGGAALVLCDECGFGDRLAGELRARGIVVSSVRAGKRCLEAGDGSFVVRPSERRDWAWLLGRLADAGRLPGQVFHCWSVSAAGFGAAAKERGVLLERGLHSLVALAPELAAACDGAEVAVALVTSQAQCVGGEVGGTPIKATAIGAARTVASEYPGLRMRAIDIDYSPAAHPQATGGLVDWAIAAIAEADGRELAVRAGEGWTLEHRMMPGALSGGRQGWLRQGGTYVVSGGLGGVGLTIAGDLARRFGARLVLIGRTELPPRGRWGELLARGDLPVAMEEKVRKLLALEAAGAQVELVVADVADVGALRRGLRRAAFRFGPISGVFHAAGTLDDGLIETRTREAITAVLRPKVEGTLALEQALEGHAPEFLMLFSSISAFAGIPGQVDYAAANAFLDAYAQSRRHDPVTRVLSVGWSQWAEVGMAAALNRLDGVAAAMPADIGEGRPITHPFLERFHSLSSQEFVVAGALSPQRHWLLDEHRVEGAGALLPGTGYLELARAAVALEMPGALEFSDFTFLRPFFVADGAVRELRVHGRRRDGGGWQITIFGRAAEDKDWVEHARGLVKGHATAPLNAMLDLDAIAGRCQPGVGGSADQPKLRFGPRWNNLSRTLMDRGEALLQLELPEAFREELGELALHPALLDFATAGAQALVPGRDPERDFLAPFTYRRFLLHAPLPAEIFSHVRLRGGEEGGQAAVFNVTITDGDGMVLAEVSEFTMMRVPETGMLGGEGISLPSPLAQPAVARQHEAIMPEEGVCVVDRLLAGAGRPHTVISPYPLSEVLARLRTPPRRAAAACVGDPADLPATEAEKNIADLWCDLLGMETVGRHDNFFDLGGHSLLAVQFTNRLRRKTGQTLPLAAMLGQPTVASLAAIIAPDSRPLDTSRAASAACDEAVAPVLSGVADGGVITIRKGGPDTPLFFIHDGLGETLLYRGLALRLDATRPILGLEPLRQSDGNFAHTRIDEMARHFVDMIRKTQETGPYLLAGLCAGGVIAFEVARLLQDLGEQVAFVGIIDAADAEARQLRFRNSRLRLARLRTQMAEVGIVNALPELARRLGNVVRWEIGSRVRNLQNRRAVRRLRAAGGLPVPDIDARQAMSFLKLYEVAFREHRPRGIFEGGMVALFKASDLTDLPDDLPYRMTYRDHALGWGKRVREEIVIVDVPGGHGSSLQEPHVETLAPLFQEALDAALAEVTPRFTESEKEERGELFGVAAE